MANQPPVNTVPGEQSADPGVPLPIAGISVSDPDTSSGFQISLIVSHGTVTVVPGLASVAGNGTGSVAIYGTLSQVNTALATVEYLADPGYDGPDTLIVTSNDSSGGDDTDTVPINVGASNTAPVVTVPGGQAAVEDTPLAIAGVSLADADGDPLVAVLSVTNGTLNVGSGAAVVGNGTGIVALAGTAAEINVALSGLRFQGNADFHGDAVLTVATSEGSGFDLETVAITVAARNDPPVLDLDADNSSGAPGTSYLTTFTEGSAPVAVTDVDVGVSDVDGMFLLSATISIVGPQAGDLLFVTGSLPPGISASSYDATTGLLTLTSVPGTTLADFQAALHAVAFSATGAGLDVPARLVSVVVSDGLANSTAAMTFIRLVPVNDAPTLDLDADNSNGLPGAANVAAFTLGGAAVAIADTDVAIGDTDDTTLSSATVVITNFRSGDTLAGPPSGPITSSFDSLSGTLTLSGVASLADYEAAIAAITFETSSADTATRLLAITVSDGEKASAPAFSFVRVLNGTPALDLDGNDSTIPGTDFAATFTEGGPAAAIADTDIAIIATGDVLGATVRLADPQAGDFLSVGTLPAGIASSGYDPDTGLLTLTGAASAAAYQAALQQIRFTAGGDDPVAGNRLVEVTVTDNVGGSNVATAFVSVAPVNDPPAIGVAPLATYREDDPPVPLSPVIALADPDDTTLTAAVVSLSGTMVEGDVLSLNGSLAGTVGGIAFAWLPGARAFVLTGAATLADYRAALAAVAFQSASDDPTSGGAEPARVVTWTVFDGESPASATSVLAIEALEELPAFHTTVAVAENQAAVALIESTGLTGAATFAIAGDDSDEFVLDPGTGALSFKTAPDFEAPTDVGQDNRYEIVIEMRAGAEVRLQHITVVVEDVKGVAIDGTRRKDVIDAGHGVAGQPMLTDEGDTIVARRGNDVVLAGAGDDTLFGRRGNDKLHGGDGDDWISGNKGNDRLDGGTGDDRLLGLGGRDTFVFATGCDHDVVSHYRPGQDRFDVRGTLVEGFADLRKLMSEVGKHVVIDFGGGDTLTIANATLKELKQHKADFDF